MVSVSIAVALPNVCCNDGTCVASEEGCADAESLCSGHDGVFFGSAAACWSQRTCEDVCTPQSEPDFGACCCDTGACEVMPDFSNCADWCQGSENILNYFPGATCDEVNCSEEPEPEEPPKVPELTTIGALVAMVIAIGYAMHMKKKQQQMGMQKQEMQKQEMQKK